MSQSTSEPPRDSSAVPAPPNRDAEQLRDGAVPAVWRWSSWLFGVRDLEQPTRRDKILLAVGLVLLVFFCVRGVTKGIDLDNDASAYLGAAERLLTDQKLYEHSGDTHEYAYPPSLAILLMPLLWTGAKPAVVIWSLGSVACLLASIRLLTGCLGSLPATWKIFLSVVPMLVIFRALDSTYGNGQANPIILLCFALCCSCLCRNRLAWAGIAIGLGASIKVAPVGMLVYFVVRRHWEALVSAVGTLVFLLVVLPLLVLGVDECGEAYDYWRTELAPVYSGIGNHDLAEDQGYVPGQSLRAWVFRYLTPSVAGKRKHSNVEVYVARLSSQQAELAYLAAALVIAILGGCAWLRGRDRIPHRVVFDFCVATTVLLLAAPYVRKSYYLLLLFPLMYLIHVARDVPWSQWGRGAAVTGVGFVVLLASTVIFDVTPPYAPLALMGIGLFLVLSVRPEVRIPLSVATVGFLVSLTASGLLGKWLANRMLALTLFAYCGVVIFAVLLQNFWWTPAQGANTNERNSDLAS